MSFFDLDNCRRCGAPVGHQEDYCEECIQIIQEESRRKRNAGSDSNKKSWQGQTQGQQE